MYNKTTNHDQKRNAPELHAMEILCQYDDRFRDCEKAECPDWKTPDNRIGVEIVSGIPKKNYQNQAVINDVLESKDPKSLGNNDRLKRLNFYICDQGNVVSGSLRVVGSETDPYAQSLIRTIYKKIEKFSNGSYTRCDEQDVFVNLSACGILFTHQIIEFCLNVVSQSDQGNVDYVFVYDDQYLYVCSMQNKQLEKHEIPHCSIDKLFEK